MNVYYHGDRQRAPVRGDMSRTIRECLSGGVRCRLWQGKTLLFDRIDPWGSFEYAAGSS